MMPINYYRWMKYRPRKMKNRKHKISRTIKKKRIVWFSRILAKLCSNNQMKMKLRRSFIYFNKNTMSERLFMQYVILVYDFFFFKGSWYSSIPNELKIQINCWLEMAKSDINSISQMKAIIAPHAGYAYSGPTAGWSYKYLKKHPIGGKLRVFLLGPCHYVYVTSCCLSKLKTYETPLGNIKID